MNNNNNFFQVSHNTHERRRKQHGRCVDFLYECFSLATVREKYLYEKLHKCKYNNNRYIYMKRWS